MKNGGTNNTRLTIITLEFGDRCENYSLASRGTSGLLWAGRELADLFTAGRRKRAAASSCKECDPWKRTAWKGFRVFPELDFTACRLPEGHVTRRQWVMNWCCSKSWLATHCRILSMCYAFRKRCHFWTTNWVEKSMPFPSPYSRKAYRLNIKASTRLNRFVFVLNNMSDVCS